MFNKQKLAIGLDIGSYAVKVCEFAEAGDRVKLEKLGTAVLPEGAVEDGVLQDPDAVGSVIKELLSNLKIKVKKVAISISGYSVIVKKINLAVMEPEELADYIMSEAEQYIPFDIDDVFLDFQDLNTGGAGSDRTDIMLVAAKKEVVNNYIEMLSKIGLSTVVVDVDAFALENAFENNFSLKENVALIDIGASKMSINIISGGTSILARDVVLGSKQVTEQIQSRFDLSFEEAEALKVGLVQPGDNKADLEDIFVNECTQWILEIKKALDFFFSSNPDQSIDKLVLSGGGAKIMGLDKFLSEETGVPTEVFNPFAKVDVDAGTIDPQYVQQVGPEMAISAGLATRPVAF